jgi:hypothetical protein
MLYVYGCAFEIMKKSTASGCMIVIISKWYSGLFVVCLFACLFQNAGWFW